MSERTSRQRTDQENHPKTPEKRKLDRELDKELEDTFPASDPPSVTQPTPDADKD